MPLTTSYSASIEAPEGDTTFDLPLDYAGRWRLLVRNLGPGDVTAITIAESPLGTLFGDDSDSLGTIAADGGMEIQPDGATPDCARTLRVTVTTDDDATLAVELAGV